ncbi:DUF262 domain-containing protein [Kribbella albertanoniae]|uniref:DUF262 domain-containing protein n=1 Tax=Kribbella albertanoniae TaxID=1266829 RepID=UPI0014048CFC|nr:DUF262 domain-containing protein [Kribbella albertanoniae]
MKFEPKDPDIETLVGRIRRGLIDLQPDFQRGEVWPASKKQRLIDSILRRWHIPPIHLVAREDGTFDVLDGQQRLTAIRDFVRNDFPVGSKIEPLDAGIEGLSGLRYNDLPPAVRNSFDTFPIRIFELRDYSSEEPHELFFRLNQPTTLTEAEKRNAFIGSPRNQVKQLTRWAIDEGMTPERIGFSNARMAYDDLLARFLITVEQGTLLEKVTAAKVTNRYRRDDEFSERVLTEAKAALKHVLSSPPFQARAEGVKPNKATIHTWLCVAAKLHRSDSLSALGEVLDSTMLWVEQSRFLRDMHARMGPTASGTLAVFHDRSTSRVADVSSVILRDLTAWMFLAWHLGVTGPTDTSRPTELTRISANPLLQLGHEFALSNDAWEFVRQEPSDLDAGLLSFATRADWGGASWL